MWTLILVASMFHDGGGRPVSVSIESVAGFKSKAACTYAASVVPNPKPGERDSSSIRAVCVKDSEE